MKKKKHIYKRPSNKMPDVKIEQKLLEESSSIITGDQEPTHIVIHEVSLGTGRSPESYNMEHYHNLINEFSKNGRTVGYHYLVGDNEVYQFVPDNKATDHTGTQFGNHNSIGIERLICKGINYEYAVHNQAKLVATLMLKYGISIKNVYTHRQMQAEYGNETKRQNPTQCPQRLIKGVRGTVQDFKHEVERCFLYGWFFEDILDEEQIKQIPDLMEIAKKRQREKIESKKRAGHEKVVTSMKDIDEGVR